MNKVNSVACFIVLLVFTLPAHALRIHYDPLRDETLVKCDRLAESGENDEAKQCFEALLVSPSLLVRAEAAHFLREVKLANRLFRQALEESDDPYIRTRWGYLYLTTHQISDAAALFRESLEQNPGNVAARLGLAEAQGRRFQGQARQDLYDIIRTNPEEIHALVLLARIELELQRLEDAEGLLDAALNLAEQQAHSPLEIYALYAALDLLKGNPDSDAIQKALEINPHYTSIYSIPAHFYIITYRYREAVDLYKKAVKLDPEYAQGHSKLGINLLRVNNIFAARYHLERAYEIDPFNTETVNTLRLLEDMDDMRIAFKDVSHPHTGKHLGRMIVRLNREDVDALQPYVMSLSERAIQVFTERYDFQLEKPVIIELYHNHDDFGVRTVSTPGIGLLGVTFGYVLAMDSPKAQASGDFHWGSTLWHEIAHVFTLEAANHLLPRWYSEGLSVYEEWHTGPLRNRELPIQVLQKLSQNEFLPIADLDSGFVRPTYEGQVSVSYMQAGLVCTFIARRWGHEALVGMLKSFGDGIKTVEAIEKHLDIDVKEFDKAFLQDTKERYARILQNLDEWTRLPQQMNGAATRADWDLVKVLADRMISLYPEYTADGNGYLFKASAQREQGDKDGALQTLLQWHSKGGQDAPRLRELAKELADVNRVTESINVLESINWISPYHIEEHQLLGDHYLQLNQPELALTEYSALIGSSADYASSGWLGKAKAYQMQGREQEAIRSVLIALESAPFYREAQRLLLELVSGDTVD